MEEALKQSHARMTALVEAIPDVMYRVSHEGICREDFGRKKRYSLTTSENIVGKPRATSFRFTSGKSFSAV